ncbi:MAG TPA: SNF2-related protein [Marmoricola sp.]
MSFVPLQGRAEYVPAVPPRESQVVFSSRPGQATRVIRMPMRGAIPVLSRAMREESAHPSVGLLSGATMLAMRLVAAGRVSRGDDGASWRAGPLLPEDDDRVRALAASRTYDDLDAGRAEQLVRSMLDAVADTMTRTAAVLPSRPAGGGAPAGRWRDRLADQVADDELPSEVTLALRIEAPEERLAAGELVVVPQVHDRDDPTHFADAGELWGVGGTGFSRLARVSAGVALRAAAAAWPPLDRLLQQPVPDRMVLDGDDLADLLEHGLAALAAAGVDVFWPRGLRAELSGVATVDAAAPRPGHHQGDELMTGLLTPQALFSFDWRLAFGEEPDDRLTDEEMSALAAAATPVIRLRDQWMVVDPVLARRARRHLRARAEGRATVKPMAALQSALTGALEVDGERVVVHPGASLLRLRARITDAAGVAPLPEPAGLAASLRRYQRQGFTWLAELTGVGLGACLADDMGLGKTVMLIALHLHRRERGLAAGPTLVVCPASLLGNWETEIRRFAPSVPVRRFHGAARELPGPGEGAQGVGDGFVLTTYGTMRRDHDRLGTIGWDLVVADEAQHVKNALSSTARALRTIASRCRVALTGTPVENDLTELWAILDWATPGLLGSRAAFRRAWAAPIESGADTGRAREFAQLVEPFLLRRRKSDPGIAPELPPKTETDQVVSLTREQVVLYEALVRESMARIAQADPEARRGLVLALLTGLKQICNHPAHYLRQANGRLPGRSQKLDALDELLGTILAEDGAVLVFTQYVAMARLLERHLLAAGIPSLFLHGGTPARERESMVAAFQSGAAPVFLLSLKAGGTGLNLTRADHVVHVDRWWNPAVEDQATDRAHRLGQTRPVQVHRLVTEGTIEQKIGELLLRKRGLADAVLGRGETALTELSDDELRDLVTLRRVRPPDA